jgi:ABC-type lipoprotein export system ATPase subunit
VILVAEDIAKTWSASGSPVHAVRPASLAVAAGEAVVISGPPGSGKTTLLSILGGLRAPDTGRVRLGDVDLYAEPPAARSGSRGSASCSSAAS